MISHMAKKWRPSAKKHLIPTALNLKLTASNSLGYATHRTGITHFQTPTCIESHRAEDPQLSFACAASYCGISLLKDLIDDVMFVRVCIEL